MAGEDSQASLPVAGAGADPATSWFAWSAHARTRSARAALLGELFALLDLFERFAAASAVVDRRDRDEPHWIGLLQEFLQVQSSSLVHDWWTSSEGASLVRDSVLAVRRDEIAHWARRGNDAAALAHARVRILSDLARLFDVVGDYDTVAGSVGASVGGGQVALAWLRQREPALGAVVSALSAMVGVDWVPPVVARSLSLHPGEAGVSAAPSVPATWVARANEQLCEQSAIARRRAALSGTAPVDPFAVDLAPGASSAVVVWSPFVARVVGTGPAAVLEVLPSAGAPSMLVFDPGLIEDRLSQWADALGVERTGLCVLVPSGAVVARWLGAGALTEAVGLAPGAWACPHDLAPQRLCEIVCRALSIGELAGDLWLKWPGYAGESSC